MVLSIDRLWKFFFYYISFILSGDGRGDVIGVAAKIDKYAKI